MNKIDTSQRPPRSLRKHIRRVKATLRRELGREDAVKAIERELRGYRRKRGAASTS